MSHIIAPAVEIDDLVKEDLLDYCAEPGQVTVHITYNVKNFGGAIRIWPTTFLIPAGGGSWAKLLTAYKISLAPQWTILNRLGDYRFTLVFSALPKHCDLFDLYEKIDQQYGFWIKNIKRTKTDVYNLRLEED